MIAIKTKYTLMLANNISTFGDYFTKIAIMFSIFIKTKSVFNVSLILLITSLVSIFLAPVIGYLVDNFNKKKLIFYCSIFNFFVTFLLFLLNEHTNALYFLLFFNIFFNNIIKTTYLALIPLVVSKDELFDFNQLNTSINSVLRIICPVLGASLFFIIDKKIFIIDSITFLCSAILIKLIEINYINHQRSRKTTLISSLKTFKNIEKEYKGILSISIMYSFSLFTITLINICLPFFVESVLKEKLSFVGVLEGVIGAGMISNFLIYQFLKKNIKKINKFYLFFLGNCFIGIGILLSGLILNKYIIILFFILIGIGISNTTNCSNIIFQNRINQNKLGKIFAFHNAIINVSILFSTILSPLIIKIIGYKEVFILSGGVILLPALYFIFYLYKYPEKKVIIKKKT